MATRAQMISDLSRGTTQSQGLSREQMIADLSGGQPQAPTQDKQINNVQHRNISFADRALVKNLGGSPEEQISYLQGKHPDMQFSLDANKRIITKTNQEKAWSRIDPTGFDSQDITDVGGDIVSGFAEAAGTAGGALLGTAAGPAGTMLGGMAGAGAASAATTALKQKIGEALGMNSFKGGEVGTNAAISAALTPVFGLGGGAWKEKLGQKLADRFAEKRAAGELSREAIKKGVSSMGGMENGILNPLKKLKDEAFPAIAQLTTGNKPDLTKTYFDQTNKSYLKYIPVREGQKVPTSPQQGINMLDKGDLPEFASNFMSDLTAKAKDKVGEIQGKYTDLFKGKTLDISPAVENLKTAIQDIKDQPMSLEVHKQTEQGLKKIQDLLFKVTRKGSKKKAALTGRGLDFQTVADIKRNLWNDFTNPKNIQTYIKAKNGSEIASEAANNIAKTVKKSLKHIETTLEKTKGYANLRSQYAKPIQNLETLLKYEGKGGKSFAVLQNKDSRSAERLFSANQVHNISKTLGMDYEGASNFLRAHLVWKKPSLLPTSGASYTAGRSAIPAALAYFGMGGGPAGYALGGASLLATGPKGSKLMGRAGQYIGNQIKKGAKRTFLDKKGMQRGLWNVVSHKINSNANK